MPEKWTGDLVGKMHLHRITNKMLAQALGVSEQYVCMVLNGARSPEGAEERFNAAIDKLIETNNHADAEAS